MANEDTWRTGSAKFGADPFTNLRRYRRRRGANRADITTCGDGSDRHKVLQINGEYEVECIATTGHGLDTWIGQNRTLYLYPNTAGTSTFEQCDTQCYDVSEAGQVKDATILTLLFSSEALPTTPAVTIS